MPGLPPIWDFLCLTLVTNKGKTEYSVSVLLGCFLILGLRLIDIPSPADIFTAVVIAYSFTCRLSTRCLPRNKKSKKRDYQILLVFKWKGINKKYKACAAKRRFKALFNDLFKRIQILQDSPWQFFPHVSWRLSWRDFLVKASDTIIQICQCKQQLFIFRKSSRITHNQVFQLHKQL